MKLIIESDGTLKGTRMEFQMTADEVPKMVEKYQRRKSRLKRRQPPDITVDPSLQQDDVAGQALWVPNS